MNSPLRILYLENDIADAELVQETLEIDGIACALTRVETEPGFLAALEQGGFDLILADYALPSFDGLSALRITRQRSPELPFIFVSGTMGEEFAIDALKIGATDYVLKVRLSRLVPSVRRALREAKERAELRRSEEALRRSEKELRDVIDAIPTMAFSTRPDGSSHWVNQRWVEYTGLAMEEISGGGWQSTLHPDDLEGHLSKWQCSLATGETFENEARHRNAKGEYRWLLVRAVPLRDEQGNILKWYGVLTDIEDRKRAETLLSAEKRILEMVAKGDSLPEILDSLCRLVEEQTSGVLASILLVEGNRLRHGSAPNLPKSYTDAIEGLTIGPFAAPCGTAAYCGQQVVVEDIATDPLWKDYRDGALPHSLRACWSTPVFSSQGKVIATFAMYYREPRTPSPREQEIIEQITGFTGVAIEGKLIHEQLQRSEAYLAEAQKFTHTGSWAWDPKTQKTLYCSEEMFRIFGWDPQQGGPHGQQLWEQLLPEDYERVREGLMRAVREKIDYAADFRIVLPDGTLKHVHSVSHPVLDKAGEIVEYIGTVVDVTERKRAEEERERLRQLEADLLHINRVSIMGELAASLAHEVKQPIAAAGTNARTGLRWLQREPPEVDAARETLSRIVKDATRAADIIDRVHSLYRRDTAQRELVDVNEIIREMIFLLHYEADRHSIVMRTELDESLPKVMADRVQLQQVLMNLMLNGIDAMKDAGGEMVIHSQSTDNGQLLISVSDSGIGLPAEHADRIFDAFITTKPTGTGMGLSISRTIVESHGGRLWASANTRRGAKFQFTLPVDVKASSRER